ncbi:MAG: helix-turn-helix domain-containing protein [Prevotella sp.]
MLLALSAMLPSSLSPKGTPAAPAAMLSASPSPTDTPVVPSPMRSITIHDGLAGESVYKIFKSRWGVIWVGTTNGLSSYDGLFVKTYRCGTQRSRNMVYDIAQASDGYIWAATAGGLYKVDGAQRWMVRATDEPASPVSCIRISGDSIYAGGEDGLYIGCTQNGRNGIKRVWLVRNHVSASNKVNDLHVEGTRVWILGDYELYQYDTLTGRLRPMGLRRRLRISNPLRMMAFTPDRIIIGTYNDGLLSYDRRTGRVSPYVDVRCRVITCLTVNGQTLYAGTDGSGLHAISLKTDSIMQTYSTARDSPLRLRDNTVYAFYRDERGVCFFGYFRQGLHHSYYTKPLFHLYPGTGGRNIRSICIDGKTKLLGSRGGLWYIDESEGIWKFFTPDELGGSIVTNVVKYQGQYYCCTFNGGVMRIDPATLRASRFGHSEALRTSSFGCLKVSPDDELWMSGNAGIYIYNARDGSERHYDSRNSQLPDAYCNDLLFDRQDRCWVSTARGLCLYDPVSRKFHDSGFPKGFFNTARETRGVCGDKENLLFYCLDGLMRTDEEMTRYGAVTHSRHFTDEYISQVIYDKRHHNYWIATETGMYRFDAALGSVSKYAMESGLNTVEFSNGAIHIDERGTLWVGTMNGLYYASLDEIQRAVTGDARIMLGHVERGGRPGSDDDIVSLTRQRSLRLAYHWGVEAFSFMPVLLNYSDQTGLCFEYRTGERGEWREQEGHRHIDIRGLSLGKNTLQVRLAGSAAVSEYSLYVYPSGLFILEWIAIAALALFAALAVMQRRRYLQQREEMARIQRELDEAKRKYSRVSTDDSEQHRLYRRLEDYMRTERPYLDSGLRLSDVASHLECSTVKLSQLFTTFVGKNYYDYINHLRLEEFKRRLGQPQYKRYTLMALAEECGFRRSSFFTTFKKVDGMTPMEYLKKTEAERA